MNYITNMAGEVLKGIGLELYSKYIELIDVAVKENNRLKLLNLISEIKREHNIDLSSIIDEFDEYNSISIHFEEKKSVHDSISDKIVKMASAHVNNHRQIIKLPYKISWDQSKALSRRIFEDKYIEDKDKTHIPLFISNHASINGRIISDLKPGEKIDFVIYEVWNKNTAGMFLRALDDRERKGRPDETFNAQFYVYEFKANMKKYLLFSLEEIKDLFCEIEGMIVSMPDKEKFGNSIGLKKKFDIIFVHSVKPVVEKIDINKARLIRNRYDKESFAKMVFGIRRHPEWFEQLVFAMLFSRPIDGFPLHFMFLGPAGTGKTKGLLFPLSAHIPEDTPKDFFSGGSGSTLKGLVPSFGGQAFEEGYYVERRRLCYVDEFLQSLRMQNGRDTGQDTGLLKTLLELIPSTPKSGRFSSDHVVRPTARMIICTNHLPKIIENFVDLCEKLDKPFLSRLFIYNQTDEHIKWVDSRKHLVIEESMRTGDDDLLPHSNGDLVSLYDFFYSTPAVFDIKKAQEIYDTFLDSIPSEAERIYRGRYFHHVCCLIDGVVKYKWLIEDREDFIARDDDYDLVMQLMSKVINSWGGRIDFRKIPLKLRKHYLDTGDAEVYFVIEKTPKITLYEINQVLGKNIHTRLLKLLDYELIQKIVEESDGKGSHNGSITYYVPYWYTGKSKGELAIDDFLANLEAKEGF